MINHRRTFLVQISLVAIVSVAVIVACQKKSGTPALEKEASDQEAKKSTSVHPVFNKNVGGPVDSATANSWKRNLAAQLQKTKGAAATTTVYYLPAAVLQQLINAENAVGVCFYYGENEQGKIDLVPIGVDNQGYVMPTATVATTSGTVSWQVAREWRQRFKNNHPSGIWGYFWGSIAVERLLAQGTEQVRIDLGLDEEGALKIMFSNAAVDEPGIYEDRTRPCPSFCPSEL